MLEICMGLRCWSDCKIPEKCEEVRYEAAGTNKFERKVRP